jgi:predicted PurR-regulated permease PerM
MNETVLQNKALTALLALVTIAFIWILLPYFGAIFWAVVLGILFAPLQRRLLLRLGGRRNLATSLALVVCLLIAVLPVIIISTLLVQEGAALYQRVESGQLDIAGYIERGKDMLPNLPSMPWTAWAWATSTACATRSPSGPPRVASSLQARRSASGRAHSSSW